MNSHYRMRLEWKDVSKRMATLVHHAYIHDESPDTVNHLAPILRKAGIKVEIAYVSETPARTVMIPLKAKDVGYVKDRKGDWHRKHEAPKGCVPINRKLR